MSSDLTHSKRPKLRSDNQIEKSPRDGCASSAAIEKAGYDASIARVIETRTVPFVVGQLGQSLDGRIATVTGASKWINGPAALDHLHRLRAVVDAVVVGAGTAIADNPQLSVRRVIGSSPARVIIDPEGRVPQSSHCFEDDGTRRIIISTAPRRVSANVECIVVPRSDGLMDPQRIIQALHHVGLSKILIEGGATTVSAFLDAGALDRLHLLLAPVIVGSGLPGLTLKPIATLDEAYRPSTDVHILDDGNVLFDCNLKR